MKCLPPRGEKIAQILLVALAAVLCAACRDDGSKAERYGANGEERFASGDYNSAEIEFKNAVREQPRNAHALRRLGMIWHERGSPVLAVGFLMRSKELDPGNDDLRIELAEVLHSLGEHAAARKEAVEVLERNPGHRAALVTLALTAFTPAEVEESAGRVGDWKSADDVSVPLAAGILAFRQQRLDEAAAALDKARLIDPASSRVLSWQAMLHRAQGRTAEADTCLAEAARVAPARSPVRIARAAALIEGGQREAGIELLRQSVEEAPDFLAGWRLLAREAAGRGDAKGAGEFLGRIFTRDPLDLEAGLIQMRLWLKQDDPPPPPTLLEFGGRFVRAYPKSAQMHFECARAHVKAGDAASATSSLDQALKIDPELRFAFLLKAGLALQGGPPGEVARDLEQWLERHPDDGHARLLHAAALHAEGKSEAALEILRKLTAVPEAPWQTRFQLGQVLRATGNPDEARGAFEEVLRADPAHFPTLAELVALDLGAGDPESALRRIGAFEPAHSGRAGVHFLKAKVRLHQSDAVEAEKELRAALELDPSLTAAYEELVKLQMVSGREAEALAELRRQCEADPDNSRALMSIGEIHDRAGRFAEARATYEQILKIEPTFVPALNNLAYLLCTAPEPDLERAHELVGKANTLAPGETAIMDTFGWVLYQQGAIPRAMTLLGQAAAGSDQPAVSLHHGMACLAGADAAAAAAAFRRALELEGEAAGRSAAQVALERLEATLQAGPGDLAALVGRVKDEPRDLVSALKLGELQEASGGHRAAAATYEAALKTNPALVEAAKRLARLYAGPLDDIGKTMEFAGKARRLDVEDKETVAILAVATLRSGKHRDAQTLFKQCLPALEGRADLLMHAAMAAYSTGQVEEARALAQRAVELPADAPGRDGAVGFLGLLDGNSSAESIEAILTEKPGHVPALMAKAALAERDGRPDDAVKDYREALRVYPDFKPAAAAIQRLEREARDPR